MTKTTFVWTPERIEEAQQELAAHNGRQALAAQALSARWNYPISRGALAGVLGRMARNQASWKAALAATPAPATSAEPKAPTATSTSAEDRPEDRPVVTAAPYIHTSRTRAEGYLAISDLQIPFHLPNALSFVETCRREFGVSKDNMLCVGDEIDAYFGSLYAKHPDVPYSPNSELAAAKDILKQWYAMYPRMKLANSNHPQRWLKRAVEAQMPSQMLRAYREVIEAPEGWQWQDAWLIPASKRPFILEHGHEGPQGWAGLRTRPLHNGHPTVWGHSHAIAGAVPLRTRHLTTWALNVGCLIDRDAYAFHYNKPDSWQPNLGAGIVLDGGTTPVFQPYLGLR